MARVRVVAETIAGLGERVVEVALKSPELLSQFGLRPEEERLVAIEPGYSRASTASRLDAFLLPDSLQFAEYNAESPAGLGYSETLGEVFAEMPAMARFRETFRVRTYPADGFDFGGAAGQLSRVGRCGFAAADCDCGLARSAHLERI